MAEKRVQTIDIFRGVAILMVVLFHYTARLPAEALNIASGAPWPVSFGWIGVYFFFTISGYCIFLTLERSQTVALFLARRISRIYPAFFAAVVLLFVFQAIAYVPSVPEADFRQIAPGPIDVVLNLFFVGEIGEWVNGSFWSIAVEVKFYLLIAALAVLIADRSRLTLVFTWLSWATAAIWIGALLAQPGNMGSMSAQSLLKFLTIAPYLPFFALGILGRQRATGTMATARSLWITAAVSALVIWAQTYAGGDTAEMTRPTVNAALFLGLLWLFVRFTNGKPLPHVPYLSRGLAEIGLLSYSWYLLHETLGYSIISALNLMLPPYVALVATILATLTLAFVFAHAIEWRYRKQVEALALAVLTALARLWPRKRPASVGEV